MKQTSTRAVALAAIVALATLVGPIAVVTPAGAQSGSGATLVVDAAGGGNYTTIQAAIDAAAAGDTIEVRSGDYAGFTLDKAVTVRGDGGAVVRADRAGQAVVTADGASIVGLRFAGDYEPWGPNTYPGGGDNFTPVPTVGSQYDNVVVYVNASDVRVDGVTIDIQGYDTETSGVVLRGDGIAVTNSTILVPSSGFHGGPVLEFTAGSNVAITDDTFEENIGGYVGADQTVAVRDNTFNGTDRTFGFTGPGFGPIPANATIDVGGNGMAYVLPDDISNGTGEWWNARWFYASASLSSVLQKARDGGTVHVDAGTFDGGPFALDRPVTVAGAGTGRTVLEGGTHVVVLNATDVAIRGVTIAGGDAGVYVPTAADASGFRLTDAALVDNGRFGMYVAGDTVHAGVADNGAFDDVLLRNVRVTNHTTKGLYVEKLSNATFEHLVVDGVTDPSGPYNDGIDVNLKDGTYTNVTIRDSVVRDIRRGTPSPTSLSAAIAIKARGDGEYSAAPATLDGVALDNVTVRDSYNGLRFGEPGATNFGPTGVSVSNSVFANNTGYHLQLATFGLHLNGSGFLASGNTFDGHVVDYRSSTSPRYPTTVWSNLGDALDAAEPGDVVLATGGTYDETVRVPVDGVTLRGVGGATIAPSNATIGGAGGTRIVDFYHHENVTLDGFTIVGPSNTLADLVVGVTVWGANGTVSNLSVRHVLTGVQTASHDSANATIRDVTATDVGVGISVQSNDTLVADSTVDTAYIAGAGVLNGRFGVRLEGNRFSTVDGPAVSVSDYLPTTAGSLVMRRNDLSGSTGGLDNAGGVAVDARENYWGSLRGPSGPYGGLGVPVSGDASIEPFYVDAAMTTLNTAYVRPAEVVVDDDGPSDVDTIGTALAIAAPGDTILVMPGTYDENLVVTKNVTLTGYGATIDGRVDVVADGVTVEGFTITGASSGARVDGIHVGGGTDTVERIVVRNVTIEGLRNGGTTESVEGIQIFASHPLDGVLIDNVTIRDVVQPVAGADGIKVQAGVTNVTIRDSTIEDLHGQWAYGVVSTPSSDLSLGVPTNVRVEATTFRNISAELDKSGVGVGVDSADGSVTSVGVAPGDETSVHNSSFTDLDYGVVNKDAANVTDATYNYWGSANGPSGAGPGDGVAVTANVTYVPFLSASGGGPAAVALNRSTLAFGNVSATPDGSSRATLAVEITSTGDRPLRLATVDLVGAGVGQYAITGGGSPVTLGTLETHTVTVAYVPTVRGDASAELRIATNAPDSPTLTVGLTGTGRAPRVDVVTAEPVEFSAAVGDHDDETVTIHNGGNSPLTLSAATASPFSVQAPPASTLAAGASTSATVRFAPTARGLESGSLTLTTNDPYTPSRSVRLAGSALAPAVEPSVPNGETIDFGTVAVDSTVSVDVVLTNNGTDDLTIDDVNATGAASAAVDRTTISPDDSATINVTISPTATGHLAENVTVSTNALTDPRWPLVADVQARELDVAGSVVFGNTPVGSTHTADLTVRNTGTLPLSVDLTGGTDDAHFALVGAPSRFTVAGGGQRTVTVSFSPTAAGSLTGTLRLETNDAGGLDGVDERSVDVSLTGTGTVSSLAVIAPSTVSFGPIATGATQARTVTIRNDGTAPLTGIGRTLGGTNANQFSAGAVPASLAPGATASIPVTYRPTGVGDHRAELAFTGSGGATASAVLTGTTVPPHAALNRTSLDFGYVATAGGTSTAAVGISNVDTHGTSLRVTGAAVSGPNAGAYTVTQRPTAAIGSGRTVAVRLAFDPTADGTQTATLTLTTNDPDRPTRTVRLTGNGAAPEATLSTSTLAFGDVVYGRTARRTVTVTNTGGVDLRVTDVAPTGPDAAQVAVVGGAVPTTLVPGATKTYTVAVTPSQQAPLDAGVAVTTNANDPTATVAANPIEPVASPSPAAGSAIGFGSTRLGSAAQRRVTVTNAGGAVLELSSPTTGGANAAAFSVVDAPGTAYVPPGGSITYTVTFAPPAAAPATATLTFARVSDPDVGSLSFPLTGTGVQADARFSAPSASFGRVPVDSTATQSLALDNHGGASFGVTGVSITGDDAAAFNVSGLAVGTTVGPGASHAFTVTASPIVRDGLSATLEAETDTGGTVTAALGATGVGPDVEITRRTVDFGEVRLGATADRTIRVNNTGNAPLAVTDVTVGGGDAGQFAALTDSVVVPPRGSREVEIRFAPKTTAADVALAHQRTQRTATLTIESNDTDVVEQSIDLDLRGRGVTPALAVSQKALTYGTVLVGSTTRRTVTLRNGLSGTVPIAITGTSISGPDASAYSIRAGTDPTDTVLDPGQSTPVTVSFNPQSTGAKFATLTVRTNDSRQDTVVVFLSNRATIVTVTFGSVTMDYTSPVDGRQPQVDVYRGLDEPAQMDAFQVATTQDGDFTIKLEGSDTAFSHAEASPAFDSIRYIQATTTAVNESDFLNATFTFRVQKAALAAAGGSRSAVSLYHYDGTAYERLATQFERETRTEYVYMATTTSLSEFSVGVGQPVLSLANQRVSQPSIAAGGTVTVSVDVHNAGDAAGTQTLDLSVGGAQVQTKTVSVLAGATVTATFQFTPPSSGTYVLSVNGTRAGTVEVTGTGTGGGAEAGGHPVPVSGYPADLVSRTLRSPIVDADPRTPGTTVDLADRGSSVRAITFSTTGANGQIYLTEFRTLPADAVATAPGELVHAVDIDVPAAFADAPATVTIALPRASLRGAAPETATVVHRADDGTWSRLDTTLVSATADEVVLRAETPGFSLFGVVVSRGQVTPTPATPTATGTPAPPTTTVTPPGRSSPTPPTSTGTSVPPTATGTPPIQQPGGFDPVWLLLVLAAVVVVIAGLYYRRRR